MLKIKKPINLKPISGDKVKKLGKKMKNVTTKISEVKKDIINKDDLKPIKKLKSISKLSTTPETQMSEIDLINTADKKMKKIPKPYRNSVEASTKSSRNKVVKKFKSANNEKPILKKKLKSNSQKADGDKNSNLTDSEKGVESSKTLVQKKKIPFQKRFQKKKIPKEGELVPSLEAAPPFDQAHFNTIIKQDKIKRIIQVLNKLVKNETNRMKNSIFTDYKYNLNIACFKIPSLPKRMVKLRVKHSIADEDTLLIVKDLQRGLKVDYEPTNQHYQDLLKENGIEGIKDVMPFNQLKTEYSTFEMKNKLANLYDYYLCDGAIVGHVVGFLGKVFSSKSRCTPYAVRMGNPKLVKSEIKKALHKTCYKQGQKGNLITIAVGTHKMTPGQIADNVIHIIDQLKTTYPGGLPNIRNMTLGINLKGTSSLPIYINMGKPLEETPYIVGPREDKLTKLKEQANKILKQFEFTNNASMVRLIKDENNTNQKRKRNNGLDDEEDNDEIGSEPEVINKKKVKKTDDEIVPEPEVVNKKKIKRTEKIVEKIKVPEPGVVNKKIKKTKKIVEKIEEKESDEDDDDGEKKKGNDNESQDSDSSDDEDENSN